MHNTRTFVFVGRGNDPNLTCLHHGPENAKENGSISEIHKNMTIAHTCLADLSLVLTSNTSTVRFITLYQVIVINCSVTVQHMILQFVNCTLSGINIYDIPSHQSSTFGNIHIMFIDCTLDSHDIRIGDNNGIIFNSEPVVKIFISQSVLKNGSVDISARNIMLTIVESFLFHVSMEINVNSYIRVPSLVQIENSVFSCMLCSGKDRIISLKMTNPYALIKNCTFEYTSIEILSDGYDLQKSLFLVQIKHASFINSVKNGNGGALMIISTVENSSITIFHSKFIKSRALKRSNDEPGKGGAVFVDGDSVILEIDDCFFLNNSADDAGSALYTSTNVMASLRNTSFEINITSHIIHPVFSFRGKVVTLLGQVYLINSVHDNIVFEPFEFGHLLNNMDVSVNCPTWYQHIVTYDQRPIKTSSHMSNVSLQSLSYFKYECRPCSEGFYSASVQHNVMTYIVGNPGIKELSNTKLDCQRCPYGAQCFGHNVIPRPKYWGYWHEGKLIFQQCPATYCCPSSVSSCSVYNFCAGNREGALCGACQESFSVSIFTGECVPDSQCGKNQWFWLFTFCATVVYAGWYSFKDDIFKCIIGCFKFANKICKHKRVKDSNNSAIGKNCQMTENGDKADKGYFGIVAFYVQMTSVTKVTIEFTDNDDSESFLDGITGNIETLLDIELTKLSFNVCPIIGMTTLGHYLYKVSFLVGIYLSWFGLFLVIQFSISIIDKKENTKKYCQELQSMQLKLVKGIVEIIKYTYAGFCEFVCLSLVCVQVGNNYVWWYDATHMCLTNWQILVALFGLFYAVPYPFVLGKGMKHLQSNQISAIYFVYCCICPAMALFLFPRTPPESDDQNGNPKPSKASEIIISVLQGPYREDEKHMTIYWEAVVSFRRLLITAMTLVGYATIRMIFIAVLCCAFLYQHVHLYPFKVRSSNHVEGLSLLLLCVTSCINLLKACLTDTGVVPSGPSVPLFKALVQCEKMCLFILLLFIVLIECKSYKVRESNSVQ